MPRTLSRWRPGTESWAIGVDLGGSWVRVLARGSRGGRRAFKRRAPALDAVPAMLRALWLRWGLSPSGIDALVVASRGIWSAGERRARERRLARLARRVRVISDAEAAYRGALDERAGALVLAGTGSIALGRDARGRWRRAGGLGPLLGDGGSAFWIGREWLRAAARGGGFERVRRIVHAPDAVARIAALAPGVLSRARAGSGPARAIVTAAQGALADSLVEVARGLRLRPPVAVSWAGSLLGDPRFRAGLWRAARRRGLRVRIERPRESGAAAALSLAARLAGRASRGRRRDR